MTATSRSDVEELAPGTGHVPGVIRELDVDGYVREGSTAGESHH